MALIKCKECGKEVSDKAAACPGCGAPIAPSSPVVSLKPSSHANVTRTGAKWEGIGFILIILGMFMLFVGNPFVAVTGGIAILVGFIVFLVGRFK